MVSRDQAQRQNWSGEVIKYEVKENKIKMLFPDRGSDNKYNYLKINDIVHY